MVQNLQRGGAECALPYKVYLIIYSYIYIYNKIISVAHLTTRHALSLGLVEKKYSGKLILS